MDTIDQIINAVQDYGDRERNFGKAMARANRSEELRWDKAAEQSLIEVRRLIEQHVNPEGA